MSENFIDLPSTIVIAGTAKIAQINLGAQILASTVTGEMIILSSDIQLQGDLLNDGTIGLDPTTLVINGPLTGTGIIQISQASTLELNGSVSSGQTIQFASTDAELILGDPSDFSGTITSLSYGDIIDISNLPFSSETISLNENTLSILGSDNSLLTALNLYTDLSAADLQISTDGSDGSQITVIPCFLKNTMISTEKGKCPVQNLKIGDLVITQDQTPHKIKWIGHRTYRQPYRPSDRAVFPIRVSKSAFEHNIPSADLFISPEHSVLLDDFLIPIKYLVNGKSIRIIDTLEEISYYHIELERHDIILAEDTPVETFIDSGSRRKFENFLDYRRMYPVDEQRSMSFCRPKLRNAKETADIRSRLAERAGCQKKFKRSKLDLNFLGFLDEVSRSRVSGWAWLPDHPEKYVDLDVIVDNGLIATVTADRFRHDLLSAKIGNGFYGFELTFSPALSELDHIIDVRLSKSHKSIVSCPTVLRCTNTIKSANNRTPKKGTSNYKRALFIDCFWPDATRDAASNAILNHTRIFQKMGYEIDFIATDTCSTKVEQELVKRDINVKLPCDFPTVESLLQSSEAKYSFVYLHRLDIAKRYAGLIRSISRDQNGQQSFTIYSLADLQFLRVMREAVVKQDASLATCGINLLKDELLTIQQVDAIVTHSLIEATILRQKYPDINLNIVPWCVKPRTINSKFSGRDGIGFLGSFQHSPNRDSVSWLIFDIMPALWDINPQIRLKIFGTGWSESSLPKLDERIDIIGHVGDLYEEMRDIKVTVAPLRFGAGIKGKVLDSLAFGIPCVMTSCAAEGIFEDQSYNSLINDSAAGIASILAELHANEASNIKFAKIGQNIIKRFYNENVIFEAMMNVLAKRQTPDWITEPRLS